MRSRWQRLQDGGRQPRRAALATSTSSVRAGGSSSVFSSALAAKRLSASAGVMSADLVAAAVARQRQIRGQLAHLLDADLLRILQRPQQREIRVLQRGHAAAADARPARAAAARAAQQQLRGPDGEPLPAGARGFVDEQRVRQASAGVCRSKRLHVLAEPGGHRSEGRQRLGRRGRGCGVAARGAHACAALARSSASTAPICASTCASGRAASMTRKRARLAAREREIPRAHLLEEFERLRLEAIGTGSPVLARARARQSELAPADRAAACSRARDPACTAARQRLDQRAHRRRGRCPGRRAWHR